jgi:hypothetical protein
VRCVKATRLYDCFTGNGGKEMYALPTSNYLKRSLWVNNHGAFMAKRKLPMSHEEQVKQRLLHLGVTRTGLLRSESRYLPHIIHPNETIGGVVYGRHPDGFAMLIATDRRVIFLDKKPLFVNEDEVTYDVVSGVKKSILGVTSSVTLHTKVKDYPIRTLNHRCAQSFVDYIEARRLEHGQRKDS